MVALLELCSSQAVIVRHHSMTLLMLVIVTGAPIMAITAMIGMCPYDPTEMTGDTPFMSWIMAIPHMWPMLPKICPAQTDMPTGLHHPGQRQTDVANIPCLNLSRKLQLVSGHKN